jgi:RPA family protein
VTGRETAWRLLANELAASTEEERGTGERVASYLLTPLGARANRVLVCGMLDPAEMIGRDEAAPFFRARLTDPTGTMSITAGGFQPRALAALKAVGSSAPALIVGKAHLFRGQDGIGHASVRAEAVRRLTAEEYRGCLAEALDHSSRRYGLLRQLSRAEPPTDADLLKGGYPETWIRSARGSRTRYPTVDPETFRPGLLAVLETVRSPDPLGRPSPPEPAAPAVTIVRSSPPAPRAAPSAGERAAESAFLDLIDELAEVSVDGYADLKDVLSGAAQRGLSEQASEELLNRLEETGAVEEPIVGKLRRN